MMDDHLAIGWGYKLFKVMLVLLVIVAGIFIVLFIRDHRPLDKEGHLEELEMLQVAYNMRTEDLSAFYQRRISSAPNEVLSIKYQQEKNEALEEAQSLYFSDRAAILAGNHLVLQEHWSGELEKIDPEEIRARMLE